MKIIITGGAGFIGSNTARRLIKNGHDVVIIDNLCRAGSEKNLSWLKGEGNFRFHQVDLRDRNGLEAIFSQEKGIEAIIHLAAQVAVTTSVLDPREDFDINALGTFNLLEAIRLYCPDAAVLYASTNKVYGECLHLNVHEDNGRYGYQNHPEGVDESMPLDFHSPYGCSKGCADQYMIDYFRIYGIRTVVYRQSCIYGYRQFGVEDQGWVAWFIIATVLGKDITIYGDGKQVRDVLFIDDLVDLYERNLQNIDTVAGKAFNVGGGQAFSMSLLELVSHLERLSGEKITYARDDWRPGDQKVFISNNSKVTDSCGWAPTISPEKGVEKLYGWVKANKGLFS